MCRASSSIAAAGVQKSEQFKLNPISRTVSFINCLKFVILAHGRSSLTMKDVKLHHHSQLQFVMRIWSFNFFSSSFICFLVHLLPHRKSNFPFMFPASHRTNMCLWLSMRNDHLYRLLVYQLVEQNMYQSQILKKGSALHLSVLT